MLVDVHVLDLWWIDLLFVSSSVHSFKIHLVLLLEFLDTAVEIMDQDVLIDNFLTCKCCCCLLISKPTSTRSWLYSSSSHLVYWDSYWNLFCILSRSLIFPRVFIDYLCWSLLCNYFYWLSFFLWMIVNLHNLLIGFWDIMDKLASHSIWAISIGWKFLAQLGLVENWDISLDHHLRFIMSEWAL